MSWTLLIREKAKKHLHRLPQKEQKRIREALFELTKNPYSGDISKLENEDDLWRRRIGAYRIKFQIRSKEMVIYVYEIERRTSKTY